MSIEGVLADAAEVADAREGNRNELVVEFIHPESAERDLAANRLALTNLEGRDGLFGFGGHRVLASDGRELSDAVFERFRVLGGIANADIDDDLLKLRALHGGR